MKQYLRLDLYINGKEFMIDESTEASTSEFEQSVRVAKLPFAELEETLKSNGSVQLTAEQITSDDMQDKLWDITGREVKAADEVQYVMCLWAREDGEEAEHVRSQVTMAEFE